MSLNTSYMEGFDGWYKEKCSKCGLEIAWNTDLKYNKHYGSVTLVKAPGTYTFSKWCVQYYDYDLSRDLILPIARNDVELGVCYTYKDLKKRMDAGNEIRDKNADLVSIAKTYNNKSKLKEITSEIDSIEADGKIADAELTAHVASCLQCKKLGLVYPKE